MLNTNLDLAACQNPFGHVWGSVKAAKPYFDAYTALRLRKIILNPLFSSSSLDLDHAHPICRGQYKLDLELLCGDKLSMIAGISKAELKRGYIAKMSLKVIEVYEDVINLRRIQFPSGFWSGWQGQINFTICLRYALEQKCHLTMQRKPRIIAHQLLKQNQAAFLRSVCGREDWASFMAHFKLHGGMKVVANNSISIVIRRAYPWAFDLTTPEGEHLHHDDFRQNDMWQGIDGEKMARRMCKHRLEKHRGLVMARGSGIFDQRLLRHNQAALLAHLGFPTWRDLFNAEGLAGLLYSRPDLFSGKPGKVIRWAYRWAFDWRTPEGEHLHDFDFEDIAIFPTDHDLRRAVLHESRSEGWDIWGYFQNMTPAWLISHGLATISSMPKLNLFRKVFPREFAQGVIGEADFRNQGTMRTDKLPALRKIKLMRANKTEYGVIYVDRVIYYFPKEYIGFVARKESTEHGIIFAVKDAPAPNAPTRKIIVPIKAFRLITGPKNYHMPELFDYDREENPILPKSCKEKLMKLGCNPERLTIEQQKAIRQFITQSGLDSLDAVTLSQMINP